MPARQASRTVWRVGHYTAPLAFTPRERCSWDHRFDDPQRRWRTLYCAELPETCLREVLADLRPSTSQIADFQRVFGPEARTELSGSAVTASWRQENVLAQATLDVAGQVLDLTDQWIRHQIELQHAALLHEHGMSHLDLSEITNSRRPVTQTIAAEAYDSGCAAVRFPSRLDGSVCFALFEGRAELQADGAPVPLTDPAPLALRKVAAAWDLTVAAAPAPDRAPFNTTM